MSRIIAVTNQKGGVGKTTTSINLSAYLAKLGRKVLLIDLDPQGNTSGGLGLDKSKLKHSLYDLLVNDVPAKKIIVKTKIKRLALLPTNSDLAAAEVELVKTTDRERRLRFMLEQVRDEYDIILIDCPPSLGLLTVNGLTAADHVIIPVQSEYYSLEGLGQLLHSIKRVNSGLNPHLDVLGIVVTMYDKRTMLSQQVLKELTKHFPDKLFSTHIPRNIRLAEAPSFGKTIMEYDRWSAGARSYKSLAKEVLERVR